MTSEAWEKVEKRMSNAKNYPDFREKLRKDELLKELCDTVYILGYKGLREWWKYVKQYPDYSFPTEAK
jgi:hypothetical protein